MYREPPVRRLHMKARGTRVTLYHGKKPPLISTVEIFHGHRKKARPSCAVHNKLVAHTWQQMLACRLQLQPPPPRLHVVINFKQCDRLAHHRCMEQTKPATSGQTITLGVPQCWQCHHLLQPTYSRSTGSTAQHITSWHAVSNTTRYASTVTSRPYAHPLLVAHPLSHACW